MGTAGTAEEKYLQPANEAASIRSFPNQSLQTAGQIANQAAGSAIFSRYLSQKAANTLKRHSRDLELFTEYLLDIGIMPENGADFQTNPQAWRGVTWGIVEGFIAWQLQEGYAISSVNARLSTVKVYTQLAVKASAIPREEGMLIQSVKGFSRAGAVNVDAKRPQTRIEEITYAYRPDNQDKTIVVKRRATKKRSPVPITPADAALLRRPETIPPKRYVTPCSFVCCSIMDCVPASLPCSKLAISTSLTARCASSDPRCKERRMNGQRTN